MFDLVKSGGWMMVPIILCSIASMGIIGERVWSLSRRKILPPHLVAQVWSMLKKRKLDGQTLRELQQGSPLGRVLAAGLANMQHERSIMLEAIEDVGRHEAHRLERYLNSLGTIAQISPLLGLLGTVIGMVQVFYDISAQGLGNTAAFSGGIAQALITTVAGLIVAIPTVIAHRYFRGYVDSLIIEMEQEALKLVEVIHGQRERDRDFVEKGR